MSDISYEEINDKYLDVLKEIGNIGAGNATTAIANMLSMTIDMNVPMVDLTPVEKIGGMLGSEEDIIVGIMLEVSSDISGSMMFLLDMDSAHHLVNRMMMRDPEYNADFDEMDLSAIKEIGNIIAGAYLSALSGLTNLTITPSIPYVAVDMAAAILSVPAIQFSMVSDNALIIKTEIGGENAINGYFILMPEGDSYAKILQALGIPI